MPLSAEQFAQSPLVYAATGRLDALLCGHSLDEFVACEPAMRRLRDYAQATWGLPELASDWADDRLVAAIALADLEKLERLALWIGALRYSEALRRIIDGDKREELAKHLPGIYPGCLRGALNVRDWLKKCSGVDGSALPADYGQFRSYGWEVLTALLRRVPGVWERWLLRLEESQADEAQGFALPAGECLPDDECISIFF